MRILIPIPIRADDQFRLRARVSLIEPIPNCLVTESWPIYSCSSWAQDACIDPAQDLMIQSFHFHFQINKNQRSSFVASK
jgi:hypothetical protein